MNNLVFLLVFIGIIYFMMIRPQQKQQKRRKEMLEGLKKGDLIITIGGIQGKIKSLKDEKLVLEIAKGVDVTILRTAVGQVIEESEESKEFDESEIKNNNESEEK